MIFAKNNIIVKIKNTNEPEYAIFNPISGSFDLMDEKDYELYQKLPEVKNPFSEFYEYLLERGYAFISQKEHEEAIAKANSEFDNEIQKSQVQLMLVPTYGCNLACTYCFQHGIEGKPVLISKEIVDAFFDYARANFSNGSQKPFITLFGGEPLVNSPAQREIIEYIVDKCADEGYELAAVTNGYDFTEYVEILKNAKIKEIQFTLDGSKEIHDRRRTTANRKSTFDKIVAGIGAAVENKMPVNLRSVVDTENIEDLVNLAEYLDKKGWLDLPPELFKTQIGRNYELFECYAKPQHLMTEVELWGKYSVLSKKYPVLAKLHRPDYKGIRHLVDTGEMYMASFDTCPACKTEWVFDLYGNIYGCTASCGRDEYLLGTYWPEVNLNTKEINKWKNRNVKNISKCADCKYDVICGGGCGVVAANNNSGSVLSPDCRPIQELMEIGVNHYIDDIRAIAEDATPLTENTAETASCCCSETTYDSCCSSAETKKDVISETNCCSCGPIDSGITTVKVDQKKTEGCLICGNDLIYADTQSKEKCMICGKYFETYVKCSEGHYVCDICHSLDILEKVEKYLFASNEANPITLAQQVFELPGLNMHGPEYHSIVPAVIVTAWQNLNNRKDASRISEAIRRGKDIKGGSCGFYGSCGAGIGVGTAVSVIEGATPMSKNERGAASRATGYALLDISKYGGPRCCKREAITAIQSFIQVTGYFNGIKSAKYICKQFGENKDCIGIRCPYFPTQNI